MIKNEGKIMDVFIQAQFDENDLLIRTNYWETEVCQKGYYYLIHYKGNYFLLTPENNDLVSEIAGTQSIVISRGNYKGKNDCFEIMFEDNSDYPYMIILEDEQVYRITNMEEGWTVDFLYIPAHWKITFIIQIKSITVSHKQFLFYSLLKKMQKT